MHIMLDEMQREIELWARKNFPDNKKLYPVLGVGEEAGELFHAVLKQEQGIRTSEDHTAQMRDSIGDIVIYLMDVCNHYNFNFSDCVSETWTEVQKRNWQKNKENGQS